MNFYVKTKYKTYFPFDGWMTKLEMRAFGWHYSGSETETSDKYDLEYDESRDKVIAKPQSKHYETFKRLSPYTSNPLFILLEGIMSVFSWIRRKLIYLFFGLIIIAIAIALLGSGSEKETAITFAIGTLAFIYVPSFVMTGLGF